MVAKKSGGDVDGKKALILGISLFIFWVLAALAFGWLVVYFGVIAAVVLFITANIAYLWYVIKQLKEA